MMSQDRDSGTHHEGTGLARESMTSYMEFNLGSSITSELKKKACTDKSEIIMRDLIGLLLATSLWTSAPTSTGPRSLQPHLRCQVADVTGLLRGRDGSERRWCAYADRYVESPKTAQALRESSVASYIASKTPTEIHHGSSITSVLQQQA
jgi:hypothetical protein